MPDYQNTLSLVIRAQALDQPVNVIAQMFPDLDSKDLCERLGRLGRPQASLA